ncbi:MAG: C39 family peptidase [Verrucomicrobiota bacterium]
MTPPLFSRIVGMVLVAAGFSQTSGQAQSDALLDEFVTKQEFWQLSHDGFMERYKSLGFRWTSSTMNSARADGKRVALQMFGTRVGETIVIFNEGKPKQLQIAIHARGDDGQISEDAFMKSVQTWQEKMTEVTGVSAVERGRDNKSAVRAEGIMWSTENTAFLLEHSSQREVKTKNIPFKSEFIRLRAAVVVKKSFMEEKLAKETRVTRSDLPSRVVRKDGDVFIEGIPMVDQGDKGYCVVATAARVFGYYDMQVDQNEIAQIANSSAEGGTSTSGMIEALDDIAGRFKVRVKTHDAMDYDDMEDLTEDYNRMAKRAGKPELPENTNQWYHFDRFDPEVLKSARLKSTSGIKRFQSEIERSIEIGVPLLWTVTVGIYPEPKRISQTRGGHMRMIIGYNKTNNEIIFSDSWGAGHEFKRWGLEEAYCSTKGLYSVLPIK